MKASSSATDIQSVRAEPPAPSSTRCQLRREGEYWTFLFHGAVVRLADSRGMRQLAFLMSHPGEMIPATALCDAQERTRRVRTAAPSSQEVERARVNVTRALRGVIDKLALQAPGVAEYFLITLRTGARCSFLPDEHTRAVWLVDTGDGRRE